MLGFFFTHRFFFLVQRLFPRFFSTLFKKKDGSNIDRCDDEFGRERMGKRVQRVFQQHHRLRAGRHGNLLLGIQIGLICLDRQFHAFARLSLFSGWDDATVVPQHRGSPPWQHIRQHQVTTSNETSSHSAGSFPCGGHPMHGKGGQQYGAGNIDRCHFFLCSP